MGLGGYLAAKSDADHYITERQREGIKKREKKREERIINILYCILTEQTYYYF